MANTLKHYRFMLISDGGICGNIETDMKWQIEKVKDKWEGWQYSKFKFGNIREVSFGSEGKQSRCNVTSETLGTWNDVYDIVNSIRPQKIEKL